jgi:hypothetical protein
MCCAQPCLACEITPSASGGTCEEQRAPTGVRSGVENVTTSKDEVIVIVWISLNKVCLSICISYTGILMSELNLSA